MFVCQRSAGAGRAARAAAAAAAGGATTRAGATGAGAAAAGGGTARRTIHDLEEGIGSLEGITSGKSSYTILRRYVQSRKI